MDLDAEVIALCYQNRWQVELFFRWFKCIPGCQHLLALSKNGVAIQVYCALIASMLITIWSGRKPTKRTFEMFQLYFLGWVTDQELEQHLNSIQENKKITPEGQEAFCAFKPYRILAPSFQAIPSHAAARLPVLYFLLFVHLYGIAILGLAKTMPNTIGADPN